jgi:2-polyprenyl-3-methyl-5-hydroxy-6-metoxy-1,4-benzoquinol methylase
VKRIQTFFDNLAGLANLINPSHILDIGCGEGFDLRNLWVRAQDTSMQYYGLDLSLAALQVAKDMLGKLPIAVVNGDIYHLPMKLDRFDAVLCLEVLEHLAHPELALKEVSQRYRGFCVFSVPNEPCYRLTRLLVYGKDVTRFGNTPGHCNHWSKGSFVDLLKRYFSVEQTVNPFPWTMVLCNSRGARA